jgi:hypothetical protein
MKLIQKLLSIFNFKHGDKVLHLIAGFAISATLLTVGLPMWFGFAGALLVGLYKEFYDHSKVSAISKKYAVNSYADWGATILGGLLAEALFYLL